MMVLCDIRSSSVRFENSNGRSAGSWELLSPLLMNLCDEEF